MTLAIMFAIGTFLAWGIGDVFNTQVARKVGPYTATFWLFLLSWVISACILPFKWHSLTLFTPPLLILSLGLAILLVLSFMCFAEALRVGEPTIVGTISGSFVALVVILSILFLHETLVTKQIIGVVVIMVGLLVTNLNIAALREKNAKPSRGTVFALLAMLGWGIYFTFIKVPIEKVGWFPPEFIANLFGPIIVLLIARTQKEKVVGLRASKAAGPLTAAAMLTGFGAIASNVAYQYGTVAVVAPITGSYPVLFAALAHYIFKEPLDWQQKTGIAITLAGIFGLSIVS